LLLRSLPESISSAKTTRSIAFRQERQRLISLFVMQETIPA